MVVVVAVVVVVVVAVVVVVVVVVVVIMVVVVVAAVRRRQLGQLGRLGPEISRGPLCGQIVRSLGSVLQTVRVESTSRNSYQAHVPEKKRWD